MSSYNMSTGICLAHMCLASYKWDLGSEDPDQMPQNVLSDQELHCLLTGISI